eukprot:3816701-Prymnesium_polylepis.1
MMYAQYHVTYHVGGARRRRSRSDGSRSGGDSRCAASRGDHNRVRHRRVQAQDVNIGPPVR